MPNVYLKDGGTVQVSLEDLGEYLFENQERIATRRKVLPRPLIENLAACPSNK
jgi:hypothetical protein